MTHDDDLAAAIADLPKFLTVAEVASVLRVDPRTVRRWIAEGRMSSYRTHPGRTGRVLVARDAVGRFLSSGVE